MKKYFRDSSTVRFFAGSGFFLALVLAVSGQTPDANEARVAEANARRAEAEARAAEIQAKKAEIELLSAQTSTSGDIIENDIAAYRAAECSAREIRKRVESFPGGVRRVVLWSPEFSNAYTDYKLLIGQFRLLRSGYEEVFQLTRSQTEREVLAASDSIPNKSVTLSSVGEFGGLLIDTISLFKTNVTVEGKSVQVSDSAFISSAMNGAGFEVVVPDLIVPMRGGADSELVSMYNLLFEYRLRGGRLLKDLPSISRAADARASSAVGTSDHRRLVEDAANINRAVSRLAALNSMWDGTVREFFAPTVVTEESTTQNPGATGSAASGRIVASYLRAEVLMEFANGNDPGFDWLDMRIVKAGSNARNKNNGVIDIFTGGKRLSYSGGAVASYRLFTPSGKLLSGGVVMSYMPYKKSDQISTAACMVPQ